ncbi:hypothetical protein [Allohahella sp. A8]|uniref:hypothetical protein n=1 Tax=Allohahella sp. A8 TaxID=3141461 RepID=UPI003A7F67E9
MPLLRQYLSLLPTIFFVTACGGGGGDPTPGKDPSPKTPTAGETGDNGVTPLPSNYLLDASEPVQFLSAAVLTGSASGALSSSTPDSPVDVFPGDEGFSVQWQVKSPVVFHSEKFLHLSTGKKNVAIFEMLANPVQESLSSSAECQYDNDSVLTCIKAATLVTYQFKTVTDLKPIFPSLPVVLELRSEVCPLLSSGCDLIRIGYIRFN